MLEFLSNYGYRNIWCNPYMDTPSIFQPHRLTGRRGIEREIVLPWDTQRLPDQSQTYHVYKIGQLPPAFLGIEHSIDQWTDLATVCNQNQVHIDLYINNGIEIPKSQCFIKRTRNRSVLLAVRWYDAIPDLSFFDLYIRFYSNSYIESLRSTEEEGPFIHVEGRKITRVEDTLYILNMFYDYRDRGIGAAYIQLNGIERGNLIPSQVNTGDVLEVTLDGTVYKVLDYPIADLATFDSRLDDAIKYLIHQPKYDDPIIDYRDDIDVVIMRPNLSEDGEIWGVRYHFNEDSALRMVTHQDYSMPTALVDAFVGGHPEQLDVDTAVIRLYIKRSGYHRPLVFEHNRIHELYKLPDDQIVRHLTGFDSTIPIWMAPNLEASNYTAVMRYLDVPGETNRDVSREAFGELVVEALGYNALVSVLADTPIEAVDDGGTTEVHLPPLYHTDSTIYEYNTDGRLLGFYYHLQGSEYYPRNVACARVEAVKGRMSQDLDQVVDSIAVPIDLERDYRFYLLTAVDDSELEGEWKDVTGTDAYELTEEGIVWDADLRLQGTLIRSNHLGLGYTVDAELVDGIIQIDLKANYQRGTQQVMDEPIILPLGKLDVWLNDYPLIRDIDYRLSPDNTVVIVNKAFVLNSDVQKVTIRFTDHCTSTLQQDVDYEIGHIRHGVLSRNNQFDVRDDRSFRVVAGGSLKPRDALSFSEDHSGIVMGNVPNGTPYVIEFNHPPLWSITTDSVNARREVAQEIDDYVGDLLSLRLPEPPVDQAMGIPQRYELYSPFLAAIIDDMANARLTSLTGRITDEDLEGIINPYLPFLDYDPTQLNFTWNLVSIHPHPKREPINVSVEEFAVLSRVAQRYLDDKVDLNQFLTVGELA